LVRFNRRNEKTKEKISEPFLRVELKNGGGGLRFVSCVQQGKRRKIKSGEKIMPEGDIAPQWPGS